MKKLLILLILLTTIVIARAEAPTGVFFPVAVPPPLDCGNPNHYTGVFYQPRLCQ